ncbi:hypothetical protein MKW98_009263 [Papaver atlanticum]|uniref:Uncharacterized protein n=1 Tax=Papaver atlanticum TaxID=357466 RepID=A0AAD4XQE0_9MAGN|nr:hypothetical protein MKW98_009263 [Papaver atlanticum]
MTDNKGTQALASNPRYNCRVLEGLETAKCASGNSLNNPVLCRGLEAYGVVVKCKKTKTTSPAWQCNWCLQNACEVPSRSAIGSQVAEVKGLHLLMSSAHLHASII